MGRGSHRVSFKGRVLPQLPGPPWAQPTEFPKSCPSGTSGCGATPPRTPRPSPDRPPTEPWQRTASRCQPPRAVMTIGEPGLSLQLHPRVSSLGASSCWENTNPPPLCPPHPRGRTVLGPTLHLIGTYCVQALLQSDSKQPSEAAGYSCPYVTVPGLTAELGRKARMRLGVSCGWAATPGPQSHPSPRAPPPQMLENTCPSEHTSETLCPLQG